MTATRAPQVASSPGWAEVLDKVQRALAQAAAEAAERERTAPEPDAPAPNPGPDAAAQQRWEQLDALMGGMREVVRRAEAGAAEADAALGAAEETLRGWSEALAAARRKLAEGAGAAVR